MIRRSVEGRKIVEEFNFATHIFWSFFSMDHLLKIVDAAPRTARIIRPKSYGHQQRLLCENNALWPVCVKYLAGVCTLYNTECGV